MNQQEVDEFNARVAARRKQLTLGVLTDGEIAWHNKIDALPTDAERQIGYAKFDIQLRKRLNIPENRYYSWSKWGPTPVTIYLDDHRTRIPPVKKVSKSDQTT